MSRAALVPASYVFLWRGTGAGSEVLLHLRQHTGYMDGHWASLAGHVEVGESARAAAVREVWEEAAVRLRAEDLEPLTAVQRVTADGDPVEQRIDFFWRARRWDGAPVVAEPAKNGGLGWFRLDQLPDPVQPQELRVLELLRAGGPLPPFISA
ncbi:NUDIX domain-containing protein [Modestobacter sp. I12A-02628]|uniref:NUDIX domain-containing protein n=1 Tax=Goekera deserti TaxID=2497753 RepID=A0A7K3WIZ7_9ACTN|nr:NUDIX domain-containing protein [Goekera deserti]MPQ96652.1 NUDIX domain-containing protein [Goekera deserti]NDI47036.1 NUDIX domain-containing protein [Goekera deserti]NEL56272.1 NUDIX domain-containing protein [Goekera deserti]